METCKLLREYAMYVNRVREYALDMPLQEAVERVVDECIREGILEDFLRKNRTEAIAVSIFEYNEELHLKNERKIALEEGIEQGVFQTLCSLVQDGVLTLAEAAKRAGMTEEEFSERMKKESHGEQP